jgi:hypothetical protein
VVAITFPDHRPGCNHLYGCPTVMGMVDVVEIGLAYRSGPNLSCIHGPAPIVTRQRFGLIEQLLSKPLDLAE